MSLHLAFIILLTKSVLSTIQITLTMTQQLVNKLIKQYERSLRAAKWLPHSFAMKVVRKNNTQMGICYCSAVVFGVNITTDSFVKVNVPSNKVYWCEIPTGTTKRLQLIKSLDKRLTILKSFPN